MASVRVVGDLDANFAWDGERLFQADDFAPTARVPLELRGAAASVAFESPNSWRILRDPLGINKLVLGLATGNRSGTRVASEETCRTEIRSVLDRYLCAMPTLGARIVTRQRSSSS
jgi:hypothetical protein